MTLIGATENINDDTMKTHIITTLSDSYEKTIEILEQRISAALAQQCMDGICKYFGRMTQSKEIRRCIHQSGSILPWSKW
jgi:hypothetical protein